MTTVQLKLVRIRKKLSLELVMSVPSGRLGVNVVPPAVREGTFRSAILFKTISDVHEID